MMKRRSFATGALASAGLLAGTGAARAQAWPTRPIRVVVPFPAGSATDSIARLVSREMSETLGQPMVVENRPGAGGAVAAVHVARSAPDGYTLLVGTNTQFAANVSLFRELPYNPVTDFAPVARFTTQPTVIIVRTDFPATTLAEFVALARSRPVPLTAGWGTASTQVVVSALRRAAGIQLTDVPYTGSPQSVVDVIAGTIDMAVTDLGNGLTQARGGRVRALAVTSLQRSPLAPDWPVVAETYPGFDVIGWHGMVAPPRTPAEVVTKLHEASLRALREPRVLEALGALGISPAPMGPEELARFIRADIGAWAELIRAAGITPQ
jgi:tripartite-type tricarboxylate transporter receptor subunit TctC